MNQLTATVCDQEGKIISLDTFNVEDIVRTKFIVQKRALLIVLREPYKNEDYKEVPVEYHKVTKQPTKFDHRKVTSEGYYVQVVTDPDEIKEIYKALTGKEFKGLEVYEEMKLKYEARLEELKKQHEEEEKAKTEGKSSEAEESSLSVVK